MTIEHFPKRAAVIASSVGVLLHAYTGFFQADSGKGGVTLGLLALACLPNAARMLIALGGKVRPLLGFCAAAAAMMVDATTCYAVFVAPASSTAALSLLVAPLVSLILSIPIGILVGYLISRWSRRPLTA